MVNSVSQHQRGFTLIEMSIVLVIIGLIIGGILKGQELIESSRQKNMISQVDRLKTSTTTFVDRFKSLPGDFNRVALLPNSGLLAGGNDDGIVGAVSTTSAALAASTNAGNTENTQYFQQLIAAGLGVAGSVVTSATAPTCYAGLCAAPSPLPASPFPQSGLTLHYGTHEGGGSGTVQSKQAHWLLVSRFVANGTGITGGTTDGVLSPERAFQIDNKYDDGISGGGNIRTVIVAASANCGTAAADYVATSTTVACHLLFAVE